MRHHIGGQELRKLFLENFLVCFLACVKCNDVLARIQNNDGGIDLFQRIHSLFDFTKLNAVTADFDLIVLAAEENDISI